METDQHMIRRLSLRLNLSDELDKKINDKIIRISKQLGVSQNEMIKLAVMAYENPDNPLTKADISEIALKCAENIREIVNLTNVNGSAMEGQKIDEMELFDQDDYCYIE